MIHKSGDNARKSITWLGWADKDYIAARKLIRAGLIAQGATMANTALEKYFKSLFILLDLDIPRGYVGHDIRSLYQKVVAKIPRLGSINAEFIEVLFKAYSLRYPDDLDPGYNIALNGTKLLAELDSTVFEIRKGFNFHTAKGPVATHIDTLQQDVSDDLIGDNSYFGTTVREDLFGRASHHNYELRMMENGEYLEAIYLSGPIDDDGIFMIEGLKPGP